MPSQGSVAPENITATDEVYNRLKHEILVCALQPGAELREATLAEATGFGRTPVREALKRLVHDGFIEVRPRQGYRIAPITLDDVHHVFELRLLLEPAAVELAIQRATDEQLQALHPLAHATYRPDDVSGYERFLIDHLAFHVGIARCTGNPRLARAVSDLLAEMQRLFFLSLSTHSVAQQNDEHHDLYDAILKRDAKQAREIVVNQIEQSRQRVAQALVQRMTGNSSSPSTAGAALLGSPA